MNSGEGFASNFGFSSRA